MLEQSMLAEQFRNLLAAERQAENACAELAEQVDDPQLKERLQQFCREKQRHVELAERLLEIVE